MNKKIENAKKFSSVKPERHASEQTEESKEEAKAQGFSKHGQISKEYVDSFRPKTSKEELARQLKTRSELEAELEPNTTSVEIADKGSKGYAFIVRQ